MKRNHYPTNKYSKILSRFKLRTVLYAAVLLLWLAGQAQMGQAQNHIQNNAQLASFLDYVKQNPNLAGVAAARDIAQAQVDMVLDPVALEITGGYARNDVDVSFVATGQTQNQTEPTNLDNTIVGTTQASVGLSFRPFAFGDIADELARQNINLSQSNMTYRSTLAALEIGAIEAARNLEIAKQALTLAEEGLSLALDGLNITETQFERGAATDASLRNANLRVLEAEDQTQAAKDGIVLATAALAQLISTDPNSIDLPRVSIPLPVYDVVGEKNPNIVQAGFNLRQVEILKDTFERNLYPVAQLSYNSYLNDESNLSFSIETRTLQPKISYSYQASDQALPSSGATVSNNNDLIVGLSMNISPAAIRNLEIADTQLEAAKAGIEAAEQQAELERLQLQQNINQAIRSLKTKEQALANAEADFEAVQQRIELGLAPLFEKQQSFVALSQAKLAVEQAEFSILSAVLASYSQYGVPISEVLTYLSQEDN